MERYFDPSFFASSYFRYFDLPFNPLPSVPPFCPSSILLSNDKLFNPRGDINVLPSHCPGPSCEEVPHRDATGETHAQLYAVIFRGKGGGGGVGGFAVCYHMVSHNVSVT